MAIALARRNSGEKVPIISPVISFPKDLKITGLTKKVKTDIPPTRIERTR